MKGSHVNLLPGETGGTWEQRETGETGGNFGIGATGERGEQGKRGIGEQRNQPYN